MRRNKPLAYVLSLLVAWAALWMPVSVYGQVMSGSPFQGGSGGGELTPGSTGLFGDGTINAPSIAWNTENDGTGTGFYRRAATAFSYSGNGISVLELLGTGLNLAATGTVTWSSGALGTGQDLTFARGGAPGSLRIFSGTTPTQSGTTCGTGPTIAGNNSLGSVMLGTTPGLPCTIIFNGTWTNAPKCFVNAEVLATGTTTVRATGITTGQFVITSTAALVATDKVSWFCASS